MTGSDAQYVESGRNPFEVGIILACVIYTAVAVPWFDRFASPSVRDLPRTAAVLFLSALFVAGVVALVGIRRADMTGIRLESGAMIALAGLWVAFSVLAVAASGARATALATFLSAFAVAAVWRWWQLAGRPWRKRKRAERRARAEEKESR